MERITKCSPTYFPPSIHYDPTYFSLIDPVGVGENKTPKDRYKIGANQFLC